MTLEGRVAGPWVSELDRAWAETASPIGRKEDFSLDLRDVTYSDASGKQALRSIYEQTHAELIAGSVWAQYLANKLPTANQTRTMRSQDMDSMRKTTICRTSDRIGW